VGYDAVSLGNLFPAFRRKLSPSYSRVALVMKTDLPCLHLVFVPATSSVAFLKYFSPRSRIIKDIGLTTHKVPMRTHTPFKPPGSLDYLRSS
jgi:hypothetical protein